MSELGADEVRSTTMPNGTVPPEDKGVKTIFGIKCEDGVKVCEEKKGGEERRENEESNGENKNIEVRKNGEENKNGEPEEDNEEKIIVEENEGIAEEKDIAEKEDTEEKDIAEKKDIDGKKDIAEKEDIVAKEDGEENEKKKAADVKKNKGNQEKEVSKEKEDAEETKYSEQKKDVRENEDMEIKKTDEGENKDSEEKEDEDEHALQTGGEEAEKEENETEDAEMEVSEEIEEKKTEDVVMEVSEEIEEKKTQDPGMEETEDVMMTEAANMKDEEEMVKEKKLHAVGEKDGGRAKKMVDEDKEAEVSTKKRPRGQKVSGKGGAKEKKEGGTKAKELPSTPVASSIERPVRERKSVERLVEVIEKEPDRGLQIKKGRGTPLKDIRNVAYRLARKKPADLRLIHQILFGRKGKAVNFKSNILQFSGFVWHENDEKERAKVKEKLDKCVKDTLLDFCDLFDIPVLKSSTRKEDVVIKLLDFIAAPHATTDVIFSDGEQQSTKPRKRKRVAKRTSSRSMRGSSAKQSRQKRTKSEGTPNTKGKSAHETDDEEEDEDDNENGIHDEEEPLEHSDSDLKETESEEAGHEDEGYDEDSKKGEPEMKKYSKRSPRKKEKVEADTVSRKAVLPTVAKVPVKSPSKRQAEVDDVGAKVFSRKKKNVDAPKKISSLKPEKKERAPGKRVVTSRGKSDEQKQSGPSKEELRRTICEILKEVDFNTATFTDILKQLANHYKMDLKPRKAAIKLLIQEELTKLATEHEDEEDDEDTGKGGHPKSAGKELEA